MSKGIQNNRIRTVDVIYTQLGRKYKASSNPEQRRKSEIVKFSLSDDGVDYNLYDDNLPDAEKALRIINTPQFSAWTSENELMRNRLLTQPRDVGESYEMSVTPSTLVWTIDTVKKATDRTQQSVTVNVNFPSPNGFKISIADTKYLIHAIGRDQRSFNLGNLGKESSYSENYRGSNNMEYSFVIPILYHGGQSRYPFDLVDAGSTFATQLTIASQDQGISKSIELQIKN